MACAYVWLRLHHVTFSDNQLPVGARWRGAAVPNGGRFVVHGASNKHARLHGPRTSGTLAERPPDGARHAASPDAAVAYSSADAAVHRSPFTTAAVAASAATYRLVSGHGQTQLQYRHLATEGARTQRCARRTQ